MNHPIVLLGLALIGVFWVAPQQSYAQSARFNDPFADCAAVGTINAPDARYTGVKVPSSVVQALRRVAGIADTAPDSLLVHGTTWRCMNGNVYACFVGANIPCDSRADTSRTPSAAMRTYCQQNPGADAIPAFVTGRATVYQWRCTKETPTIDRQVIQVDQAGYPADFWYKLTLARPGAAVLPATGATNRLLLLAVPGALLGLAGLVLRSRVRLAS